MDFRQLESFIAIAKNKSFSKAAKELYLTQPTISNHIQTLEKEIGTSLLNRANRDITLTKAGEIFYDYANKIINLKKNAQYNMGEFVGKIEGTIEISASTIPEQYIVPKIIREFNSIYPEVNYKINHGDSLQIIENIKSSKIDYGFTGTYLKDSDLNYVPIIEDKLVLITPKAYISSSSSSLMIEQVMQVPLILREEGSGTLNLFNKELKKNKIKSDSFNVIAFAENTQTIKAMVEEGLGCSIISSKAIEKEKKLDLFDIYEIEDLNLIRNFYFVYSKDRILAPLEKSFIDFIENLFPNK